MEKSYWVPFFSFFKLQLIYDVVPISAIQQSDPGIHTYTLPFFFFFFCLFVFLVLYLRHMEVPTLGVELEL